jgi:hypothetical protein
VSLDDIGSQLGPLPKFDENARLQEESLKALSKLLFGQGNLVFRDERIQDYGVDGSFELKIADRMTNFRAQIQMKASAGVTAVKEGYVPLQVATANLNYLLSGPSPLYILWDAQKDEFWYLWAQEENRRLFGENPSWKDQSSITLQFRNRLAREVIPSIVECVLREGRLLRNINDRLARATEGEPVIIRIDVGSLQITDASDAKSLLLASGTAIVAAGYPQRVLELMHLVDTATRDLPRMELTTGYAEYMLGNYWKALGHIRSAMTRASELSARDNSFLGNIKDASELRVGLLDSTTYEQRMKERADTLSGVEALEAEQEAIFSKCIRTTDLAERLELSKKLRDVTERILNEPQSPAAIKLEAKLLLLYVEGVEANLAATQTEFAAEIRSQLFPGDAPGVTKTLLGARQFQLRWEGQAAVALKEAYEFNHPILIFQALTVSLKIRIGKLFEESMAAITQESPYTVGSAARTRVQRELDEAVKLNAANGSIEGKLQLAELQADFLEVQGNRGDAKVLAAKTYPEALAMGFGPIAEHAKRLLEDDSLLLRWRRTYEFLKAEDNDVQRANQNDEELGRVARQLFRSVESPPARLDVIEALLRSFRRISRERIEWCRHLQILEDLTIAGDPRTAYRELPTRKCGCAKFTYETKNASVDATVVIDEFKQSYCASCSARDPKRK